MSRAAIVLLALVLGTVATAVPAQEKAQQIDSKDQRARPMVYALIAVIDSDLELFKFAFSKEVKEKVKQGEWPEGLKAYRKQFQGGLGDYKMGEIPDIRFEFWGNDRAGRIGIPNKDGKVEAFMRLIKEGSAWKLNER